MLSAKSKSELQDLRSAYGQAIVNNLYLQMSLPEKEIIKSISSQPEPPKEEEGIDFTEMIGRIVKLLEVNLELTEEGDRKRWLVDYYFSQYNKRRSFKEISAESLLDNSPLDSFWLTLLYRLETEDIKKDHAN